MFFKKTMGFTLVEILTVIIIIFILIGLLFPALTKVREQSMIKQAEAMIGALEVAINMYYTDEGEYPDSLGDLMDMSNPKAPYMDSENYDGTDFKDPWDNAYTYTAPGSNNTTTFDVWSYGPDEANGGTDDITNW